MELLHRTKFNEECTFCVTLVWWKDSFFWFLLYFLIMKTFFPLNMAWKKFFDQISLLSSVVLLWMLLLQDQSRELNKIREIWCCWNSAGQVIHEAIAVCLFFPHRECLCSQIFCKCLFCELCMAPPVWSHSHQGGGNKAGFLPGTGVPLAGEGAVAQPALLGWGFCRSPFSMEALDRCSCGISWILGTEFGVFTIV